jgi:hypothetical protein
MTTAAQAQMEAKLAELGLGAESIKVFGAIRTNVHVVCVSRETADKWAMALAQIFAARPTVVPTIWKAATNKERRLFPVRKGFLVAVAA